MPEIRLFWGCSEAYWDFAAKLVVEDLIRWKVESFVTDTDRMRIASQCLHPRSNRLSNMCDCIADIRDRFPVRSVEFDCMSKRRYRLRQLVRRRAWRAPDVGQAWTAMRILPSPRQSTKARFESQGCAFGFSIAGGEVFFLLTPQLSIRRIG